MPKDKIRIENITCSHDKQELIDNLTQIDNKMWESIDPVQFEFDLIRVDGNTGITTRIRCRHTVTSRTRTDLASAPENLLEKFGLTLWDLIFAAFGHDSVFKWPVAQGLTPGAPQTIKLTRKECDIFFKSLMKDLDGINDKRAHFFYKILRNWSWFAWLRWRLASLFGGLR